MFLLGINLLVITILWVFAFIGLKQYEFAQQDGDTGMMKFFIHIVFVFSISINIYFYVNSERSYGVSSSTMVEEIKK